MTDAPAHVAPRKFNIFLALGIFLLPIVFVWFLLRRGHSTTARIIGFGWTALFVLAVLTGGPSTSSQRDSASNTAPTTAVPATELSEADRAEIAAREEADRAGRQRREIRRSPERFLELEEQSGLRGGFDTVFLLSGRIRNKSEVDIKDPTIVCALYGPSGTHVGDVRETLLEIIPAGGTKRFTELNMGFMGSTQVARYTCEIVDAEALL
jgi:hypothetical protein